MKYSNRLTLYAISLLASTFFIKEIYPGMLMGAVGVFLLLPYFLFKGVLDNRFVLLGLLFFSVAGISWGYNTVFSEYDLYGLGLWMATSLFPILCVLILLTIKKFVRRDLVINSFYIL